MVTPSKQHNPAPSFTTREFRARVQESLEDFMPRGARPHLGGDFTGLDTTPEGKEAPKRSGHSVNGLNGKERSALDLAALLDALQAMRVGDFSVRLPSDQTGLAGKIADTFNEIVIANERMAQELEQVGQAVGRAGKTRRRVKLGHSLGAWGEMEGSINSLIDDLLWPITTVTQSIAAVARGDLLQTVPLEV